MERNRFFFNRTEVYAWLFAFVYFVGLVVIAFNLPVYE
jgi:hypothetical protein